MQNSPTFLAREAAARAVAEAAATLPQASLAASRRQRPMMAALIADCCATCGSTGPLQKCGKCRVIKYCGGECQVKGWKELGHKRSCGQTLPDQNSELASASIEAVVAWIREFQGASADLAQACVNRLGLAVVPAQDPCGAARAAAANAGATEALLLVCTRHESNINIAGPACTTIKHICKGASPAIKQRAVDAGVLETLVALLRAHAESSGMMEHALGALTNILSTGPHELHGAGNTRAFGPFAARAHAAGVVEVTVPMIRAHMAERGLGLVEACQVLVQLADPSVGGSARLVAAGAVEACVEILRAHSEVPTLCFRAVEAIKHSTNGTDLGGLERKRRACRAGVVEAVTCAMRTLTQTWRSLCGSDPSKNVIDADKVYKAGATLLYNLYGYALAGGAGAFGPDMVRPCNELATELVVKCLAAQTASVLEEAVEHAARWPEVVRECEMALDKVTRLTEVVAIAGDASDDAPVLARYTY